MRFLGLILLLFASAARAQWGWDGGCATCPEHLSKQALTDASWIRLAANGCEICATKTNAPDWSQIDRDVNGWFALGLKVILRTAFHPSDLTDAEIVAWIIEFNRQALARYGNKLTGIQPLNEPWFDDEEVGDTWAYREKRLGASHPPGVTFWTNGVSGLTTNALTPEAVAWYGKMKEVHDAVHALAAPLGVKVYGPHWSNERYVAETRMASLLGVLDGVDVFTFGCEVAGEPDGAHVAPYVDGWATYIDEILPLLNGKPWACLEFHLNHTNQPALDPDYNRARQIKKGIEMWRARNPQCICVHAGFQNWNVLLNDMTSRLCGYCYNVPTESLRVLQVAMASQTTAVVLTNFVTVGVTNTVTTNVLPTVTTADLDACYNVSARSARDIVAKHKGKVIAP